MAINYDDYVVKNKSKKHPSFVKFYRCTCDLCGSDRGYHIRSRANNICKKCAMDSEEYKTKQQNAITGKVFGPCSEHRKKKISKANTGKIKSIEAKIKQSCSARNIPIDQFVGFASESLHHRLAASLRSRFIHAIKNNHKKGSAVKDLGCTIEEFKKHLESKFEPGMTWNNWSRDGWHIDHKKPLSSFDLTDRAQLLDACHYTNLQPLWAKDNLKKGATVV